MNQPGAKYSEPRSSGCFIFVAVGTLALVVACVATSQLVGVWGPHAPIATQTPTQNKNRNGVGPQGVFAFVRDGQVYVASSGHRAHMVSHFPRPDLDLTHWGPLMWAPDDRHIAVAIGDPLVARDQVSFANGHLFILDARTGLTDLAAPQSPGDPGVAVGPAAYGWLDAQTLLFASAGHMFAYSLATASVATLSAFSGSVVELEIRRRAIYYASYHASDGPVSILGVALRRHNVETGDDIAIADLGVGRFQVTGCNGVGCEVAPGIPSVTPAWDVSVDESQIAFERISSFSPDRTRANASFWYLDAALGNGNEPPAFTGTPQPVFVGIAATLPADMLGECCFLRFAPDGHGLVLSGGYAAPTTFGPFLMYPAHHDGSYQVGYPWAFGSAAWAPDASAFTLVARQRNATAVELLTYTSTGTSSLEDDAYDCAWVNSPPPDVVNH